MAQLLRRQEQLHDGGVVVVVDVVVLRVRLWPFGTGVTVGARLTPQAPVIVVGIIAAFTAERLWPQADKLFRLRIMQRAAGVIVGFLNLLLAAVLGVQARHGRQASCHRKSGRGLWHGDTARTRAGGFRAGSPIGRVGVQFGYGQVLAGEDQLVHRAGKERQLFVNGVFTALMVLIIGVDVRVRSEERRVGKEWRGRGAVCRRTTELIRSRGREARR